MTSSYHYFVKACSLVLCMFNFVIKNGQQAPLISNKVFYPFKAFIEYYNKISPMYQISSFMTFILLFLQSQRSGISIPLSRIRSFTHYGSQSSVRSSNCSLRFEPVVDGYENCRLRTVYGFAVITILIGIACIIAMFSLWQKEAEVDAAALRSKTFKSIYKQQLEHHRKLAAKKKLKEALLKNSTRTTAAATTTAATTTLATTAATTTIVTTTVHTIETNSTTTTGLPLT